MEQVTITKIYRSEKNKQGQPLLTSDGKPYVRTAIKVKEHGDKWISGFGNATNGQWKEGDVVNINIEQKGEYLNFSMPKPLDTLEERVKKLEDEVGLLIKSARTFDVDDFMKEEAPF